MSGHTPGPWTIGTETRGSEICTIHGVPTQPTEDGKGQEWVYIHYPRIIDGEWHWISEGEKIANARLITTAPDGLTLAQSILADCTDATPVEWIEMARGIVRKAEGV